MSVNIGENGQRSVQVEVEVPGSPEEVWQAIATGPGISSWFVPSKVEERVGGEIVQTFGPGMDSASTITEWDPPRKYAEHSEGMTPGAPPVATEWLVEARSGGTCLVRVVHSWFASTDEWDGQYESIEQGWVAFFNILRLKLAHFSGQPCAAFESPGMGSGTGSEAWAAFVGPLGLDGAVVGQDVRSGPKAPFLAGKVEVVNLGAELYALVLLQEPGPGIAHIFAMPMGEQVYLSARLYLFGDDAVSDAAKVEPEWTEWMSANFSMGE